MASQIHAQDARAGSAIQLPGFKLPVNTMPELIFRHFHRVRIGRFPNAVMDWKAEGLTLREREMLSVMDSLSDKPEWRSKVFDKDLVSKWRQEAPKDWDDSHFDYVSGRAQPV